MGPKLKILHLEDIPSDVELVARELKKGEIQFEILVVANKGAFEKALTQFEPDIILADHTLPSFNSLEAMKILKQRGIPTPVILVTATVSDEYAVEIMKAGAYDYILKDRLHRLPQAVLNAMEKSKAEQQLHESETFNKGVLSSLSSQIAVVNQNGTLIAVNKAWDDFGKENGISSLNRVSVGSNYFEVCEKAIENGDRDAAEALAGIQSVFKKERQQFEMEYPCHSPSEQRWFLLSVINFGSNTQKVVISHQNITARKKAEKKITDYKYAITESSIVAITDRKGIIKYVNDNFCKISKYSAEELIGQDHRMINSGYHPKSFFENLWTTIANGKIWSGELKNRAKDGSNYWVDTNIVPFLDEKGNPYEYMAIRSDITKRKLAEKSLQLSQSNLLALIENTDAMIYSLDSGFRYITFNQQLHDTLQKNYNLDIKIGDNANIFLEKVDPEEVSQWNSIYLQALKGETVKFEKEFNIDDLYQCSSFSINPIWEDKTVVGLSCFVYDVTQQKLDQKEKEKMSIDLIQRNHELGIANKELEEFALVASHDLQEPLRMVTSFLGLIEKKYQDQIDEKGKLYIHHAVDGAKRMRQIILDLLEFSKVGKTAAAEDYIDLNELMQEVILLSKKQLGLTKATIEFENLPSLVTYKTPVRQVFQNLIGNALKYYKKGVPPLIHIAALETETSWQFSIKDNGIGIAEEHFDKIFMIFQRLHNKDEYSGTGIGLAVCKKTIENLGGKIWLESEKHKGSTFYFTLPKLSSPAILVG